MTEYQARKKQLFKKLAELNSRIAELDRRGRRTDSQEELRYKNEELWLINALNDTINRGGSLPELVKLLTKETRRIFSAYGATLYLLDEDQGHLVMQNLHLARSIVKRIQGVIGGKIPTVRLALSPDSLYRQVLRDGKPRLFNDPTQIQNLMLEFTQAIGPSGSRPYRALGRVIPQIYKVLGLRSVINIPLMAEGKAVGLLDISRRKSFSEEDLKRLERIAGHLTAAVIRKRGLEALAWESGVNKALAELSSALLSSASLEAISSLVLDHARRLTESRHGYVGYLDPRTGYLAVPALAGKIWGNNRGGSGDEPFQEFRGGWVLRNKEALLTNTEDPRASGVREGQKPMERFLSAPALLGEKLVGQVAVANSRRKYTERDLALIQRLAEIYALAIQHQQAEQEIMDQNVFLHNLIESVNHPFYVINSEDYTIQLSNSAARQDGLTAQSTCYCVTHGLTEPCSRMGHACPLEIVKETKAPVTVEHIHYNKDGQTRQVEVHAHPVFDPDGDTVRSVIEYAIDITERKQLEESLIQAQKMEAVGRLAGGIAHDFNNLLTTVLGYADMILLGSDLDQATRESAQEIKRSAERAASLTQQLLAFSRKQILKPKIIDMNQLVGDLKKMLQRLIKEDISLITNLDPDLDPIEADPGQMEQVIINLVVNSCDAMPEGGRLIIETRNIYLDKGYWPHHQEAPAGNYVLVAMTDTGRGMDEQIKERIFEPFFTTKEKGKGTGLGLSTVYGIIKQSGGYIWVYSEPNRGTTFKIYLPIVKKAAAAKVERTRNLEARRGSETILVVEDEDALRGIIKKSLHGLGYSVHEAKTGLEALEICRQRFGQHDPPAGAVDLVITDIIMPKMSGPELAEKLLSRYPQVRLLYISGYTDEGLLQGGILDRGVPFLPKPFSPDVLSRKVREVLDAAGR